MVYIFLVATIGCLPGKEVSNLKVGELQIGLSEENAREIYPQAKLIEKESDHKIGLISYQAKKSPELSRLIFRVFDKKVFEIRAIWVKDELDKVGGLEVILAQLTKKLGKPHQQRADNLIGDKLGTFIWYSADKSARAALMTQVERDGCALSLVNRSVTEQVLKARSADADTGIE